jgi:PAS domain-containing protein
MNRTTEVAGRTNLQLTEAASNVTRIAMESERSQTTLDQAPDAAARSEGQLRKIIDTIPTLVWRSLPDGRLDYLNQRWRDDTGLSLEQAHDCGWKAIVHPDDVNRVTRERLPKFSLPGNLVRQKYVCIASTVNIAGFLCASRVSATRPASAVHWYGTNTDIEGRKRAEEKVREDGLRGQLTINAIS